MLLTIEDYAALHGVSPATIRWFTTDPKDRPPSDSRDQAGRGVRS
jgi:hypothetical protein